MNSLILRPNGDYSIELEKYPESTTYNYQCVDETVHNDDDDTVSEPDVVGGFRDLYNLENIPEERQYMIIDHIKVTAWIKGQYSYYDFVLGIGGNEYRAYGNQGTSVPDTSYTEVSYSWDSNPATGDDWTVDDINNLKAGIRFQNASGGSFWAVCTQLYVTVYYIPAQGITSDSIISNRQAILGMPVTGIIFSHIILPELIKQKQADEEAGLEIIDIPTGIYKIWSE